MTAVLGSPAGVRWPPADARSVGRRRRGRTADSAAAAAPVAPEPRLRLTSRSRSLLLVAALVAVVGAGVAHGTGPLGTAGAPSSPVVGSQLAPGLPLGMPLAGRALEAPALVTPATAGAGAVAAGTGAPAGSVVPAATAAGGVVIVASGDSLWGIATRCSGAGPATAVSWIRAANGLRGSLLQPGERLVVPSGLRCQ